MTSPEKSDARILGAGSFADSFASDLPLAEATLLSALVSSEGNPARTPECLSALTGAVVERVREADEVARGDLLLALVLWSGNAKTAP